MGVSFDCFGTLVSVDRPTAPAAAVASELAARGVAVPDDWAAAYAESHLDLPEGAERSLHEHVGDALSSRGVEWDEATVREAVFAAFEPVESDRSRESAVETLPGTLEVIDAAREYGPVAICSNCSVPGLVEASLARSAIDPDAFDAIVTSVGCGWRKPSPAIFEATAAAIAVPPDALIHVGDDPRTDGGVESVGGTAISIEDVALPAFPERLAVIAGDRRSEDGGRG